MGIIDKGIGKGLTAVGLGGITRRSVNPQGFTPDFPGGMIIVEIVNGQEKISDAINLIGSFMPFKPFEYGGKQKISKDYYPGNSEPVVQVLGAQENDTTIKGKLKTKRFKDEDLKGAAQEYQELIDAMRIRGNLVKITLGEWRRYGFIEECNFRLNRLSDIEYEIKFAIVGFNPPKDCKFVADPEDDLIAPNKSVTNAAAAALANMRNYPASMPRTLAEFLNDMISVVATVIAQVTGFVDGALDDIENIEKSATRAVGLIRNAKATISRTGRRIGMIQYNAATLTQGINSASFKAAAMTANTAHIQSMLRDFSSLMALLAILQARFAKLSASTPMRRHLVKRNDTLQSLSMLYYRTADNWEKIYTQNKLTSTVLVVGNVLEIPKV